MCVSGLVCETETHLEKQRVQNSIPSAASIEAVSAETSLVARTCSAMSGDVSASNC
jgi:hypothetical protein